MRKQVLRFVVSAFTLFCALSTASAQESLSTSRFGTIKLYGDKTDVHGFVLLLSDAKGWDEEASRLAQAIAETKVLVAGVDMALYLEQAAEDDEDCHFFAGEFERLAQVVQQNAGLKTFYKPKLVGLRAGASLAYAILAESARGFDGGISIGFCPSLELDRSICEEDERLSNARDASGIVTLRPVKDLSSRWFAAADPSDKRCNQQRVSAFVSETGKAELFSMATGAHSKKFWSEAIKWPLDQLMQISSKPKTASDVSTDDLPLIDIPAERKETDYFVVFVSGDGGWASIDREIGDYLAQQGISVVGVDALRYFWNGQTPEKAGKDLDRIIHDYSDEWSKERVVLIGYSLGADVLPVMANRLSDASASKVMKVVLLNPAYKTDLKVHLTDWLGLDTADEGIALLPEMKKIGAKKLLCIYGMDDDETSCKGLPSSIGNVKAISGSHHFDGDYKRVSEIIINELKVSSGQ